MASIGYALRSRFIPPEITRTIIIYVVTEYLDDEIWRSLESSSIENPVPPVLQVGLQMRIVTLSVLSDALGIRIVDEAGVQRLESNPWEKIHDIRSLCASIVAASSPSTEAPPWQKHASSKLIRIYCQLATFKSLLDEGMASIGVSDADSDSADLYGRMTRSLEDFDDASNLSNILYDKVRIRIIAIRFEVTSFRLLHILCPMLSEVVMGIKNIDHQASVSNQLELTQGDKPDIASKIEVLRERFMTLHTQITPALLKLLRMVNSAISLNLVQATLLPNQELVRLVPPGKWDPVTELMTSVFDRKPLSGWEPEAVYGDCEELARLAYDRFIAIYPSTS